MVYLMDRTGIYLEGISVGISLNKANQFCVGNYTGSIHTTGFFYQISSVGINRMRAYEQFIGNIFRIQTFS